MNERMQLLIEADKRGILPPEMKGALDEAIKRGLVDAPSSVSRTPDALDKPDPTGSFGQNLAAGIGKTMAGAFQGAKQRLSEVPILNRLDALNPAKVQAEVDETRRLDAPLKETAGGAIGQFAGALPLALIPGGQTYAGAAAIGAGMGLLEPTAKDESVLKNVGISTAGGIAGKFVGDKIASGIASRLGNKTSDLATKQLQNTERDAILAASKKAGYVVPPSSAESGFVNNALEGISGKIKTAQVASSKNQEITNDLARRAVGLTKDDALTEGALDAIRAKAGAAYQAIKSLPTKFRTDQQFSNDISMLGNDFAAAAAEFPEIAGNPAIQALQRGLSKPEITPTGAMELIKKLRFDASKNFKAFDDPAKAALATAQKDAANALEDLIERSVTDPKLLSNFRAARELIAKTYSVESALQGGNVAAQKLASQLSKGKPLTAELRTIADFAEHFPKAAQALKEAPGATSPLDWALAMGTANPALLAARPAVRATILSKPYQAAMTAPNYTPNALLRAGASQPVNAFIRGASPLIGMDAALSYGK